MGILSVLPHARPSLPVRPVAPVTNIAAAARLRPVCLLRHRHARLCLPVSAVGPSAGKDEQLEEGRLDWLDEWYPLAPVRDLDPGTPHGKMVLGLRVVAWYDRIAGEWRVFDDACPHRLAPLSEGRIDDKGRLQCVYHGWCFDGSGSCKFIPQAPALGPPVHKSTRACAATYPAVVQNNILWFYPRTGAEHQDVVRRKRPPFIAEIEDPSFVTDYGIRDLSCGYDVLVENLLDPAHVPYAHKGLLEGARHKDEVDKEDGMPIRMKIEEANIRGFLSPLENGGYFRYAAPCTIYNSAFARDKEAEKKMKKKPRILLVFMCVPVAPGRSRVIWAFTRNVGVWLHKIVPRWVDHIVQNTIFDSDTYLLHVEERNFAVAGLENWHKNVYVPTSSDAIVVAFRNWFRKHCNSQVGWAAPVVDQLPATDTKDKLMDRYWSHVAQCTSCSAALKRLKAMEVTLQVASVTVVGFLAVANGTLVRSVAQRAAGVSLAMFFLAASRWLASFIQKTFYFQDYVHAYK